MEGDDKSYSSSIISSFGLFTLQHMEDTGNLQAQIFTILQNKKNKKQSKEVSTLHCIEFKLNII